MGVVVSEFSFNFLKIEIYGTLKKYPFNIAIAIFFSRKHVFLLIDF